jgi:hypothetical protein
MTLHKILKRDKKTGRILPTGRRKYKCSSCGGKISESAYYRKKVCRNCYLKNLSMNAKGRTPNTKCFKCGSPLYKSPNLFKKRINFACNKCHKEVKKIYMKNHPKQYEKISKIDYGTRFKKGRKLTKEQRQKASEANKGKIPWNKNKTKKQLPSLYAGKKHWNWKGGITPVNNQIRSSLKYKRWRKSIFERDNYTCQICGKVGRELQVDHYPKTFKDIITQYNIKSIDCAFQCNELWNLENNRTLCKNCHKLTPSYGIKSNNYLQNLNTKKT